MNNNIKKEIYYIRKNKFNNIKNNKKYFSYSFKYNNDINNVVKKYINFSREYLIEKNILVKTYGRIVYKRIIGKVIFINIQNILNSIQIYLSYSFLKKFNFEKIIDIGDIISVKGLIFKTKVNELTINCKKMFLLSKSFRQLPNKFKGLINKEYRIKKRYLDLISNKKSRETFINRSNILLEIRNYLNKKKFIEVETPILQSIIGGADAKPFKTYYDNNKFYLRISPELFLKKLIVGGFNKIFEIGKNFRNEGISNIHNPEFTMLELYSANTDYRYLMKFTQNIIKYICKKIFKKTYIKINNNIINFNEKFSIISMKDSILKFNNINFNINDFKSCIKFIKKNNLKLDENSNLGKIQFEIFKKTVEKKLIKPTFITEYPIDISIFSKRNLLDNTIADRFELFINGIELANGFSELNDSDDQLKRFIDQIKSKNIKFNNKNLYDKDYISALEYGLPPTSGLGIGIDRLVMILTNNMNINDVILFPSIRYKSL